jgi:phosphonate transport system substrate-binding protein
MASGAVHLYYDSLFPALVVSDQSGALPILRRWRDNSPTYHTIIFTRADSGIETLADLNGKMIAYDDPASTSGYLLPTAYLLANDLKPVEYATANSPVADDEVGYFFAGDDDNIIELILDGTVVAGVTDNLTYVNDIPEETREQLVILAETEEVARQIVLVSPALDEAVRAAVIDIMVNMTESEEGLALLEHLNTDRFDEFPEGAEAALESFRPYYDIVTGTADE